jgi:hypothetical protein
VLVDRDAAARVGFEAGVFEVQLVHVALAADGVEQSVAGDLLLALRLAMTVPSGSSSTLQLFAQAHGDAAVAQVVAEGLDDLLVGELEQRLRFSISVTRTPRMANMQVYSTPMTPPPTTIRVAAAWAYPGSGRC